MTRRSFLFGLALAVVMAVLVFVSVNAKPKKRRNVERVSGPPTLTLAAEPTTVRACDDARVQLTARASSLEGRPLRYKWTTNGGRLSGQGASPTWDLAGAQPGVYQAVVEVDDGRYLDCVAFSSASIVVADCPPPPPLARVCPNVSVSCPDAAAEGQGVDRRRLDGTARKYESAQHRHAVSRRRSGRTKRVRRYPAHISVRTELSPPPAFPIFVVDHHPLPMQGFGIERRVGRRLPP